jgi:hypothetical protein
MRVSSTTRASAPGVASAAVNSAIKREMWKDFYLGLNGYYTRDTAPSNHLAAHSDLGLAMSLGWSY